MVGSASDNVVEATRFVLGRAFYQKALKGHCRVFESRSGNVFISFAIS
jgi:hypothetical protein